MVVKHGFQRDKWVLRVYEKRSLWVIAYLRDQFFGGIRTTSICEAINSRIKLYNKRNSLVDFMQTIERACGLLYFVMLYVESKARTSPKH